MEAELATQPWRVLPRSLAEAIEPALGEIAAEIVATIGREVPEYRRPLEGSFGRGLETGVVEALRQFVALIRDPDAGRGTGRDVYVELGRGELRQGRTLDSLQAAYRLGARVAWRRLATIAQESGFEAGVLSHLAESIFAYIEELSADSVEGYAEAQSQREGERQALRRELVALLRMERPAAEAELRAAAMAAGWTLPKTVAFLACERRLGARLAHQLGPEALVSAGEELACVVVPDPHGPGRMAMIERAIASQDDAATVAIGPALPLPTGATPGATPGADAKEMADGVAYLSGARAWQLTAKAYALARARGLARLAVDDCLAELALNETADLAARLRQRLLSPLAELTPAARRRLEATLLAYIANGDNAVATAAALGVHPQTARGRIARLREFFGPSLSDPGWRFQVELALRAVGDLGRLDLGLPVAARIDRADRA